MHQESSGWWVPGSVLGNMQEKLFGAYRKLSCRKRSALTPSQRCGGLGSAGAVAKADLGVQWVRAVYGNAFPSNMAVI